MKWCHSVSDIPKGPHYALLVQKTTYIPGDERSRTNPGHGYPASTEYSWDYIVFTGREEWEEEIKRRMSSLHGKEDKVALYVTPAAVSTIVNVEIK